MQIIDALRTAMAAEIPTDIGATGRARFYDATLTTKIATMALSNPAFTDMDAQNPHAIFIGYVLEFHLLAIGRRELLQQRSG